MTVLLERNVTVRVREGLHARPAAQLVKLARSFEALVEIHRGAEAASARSSVKLMLLSIREGDTITLRAEGKDAATAIAAVGRFLEDDSETPPPEQIFSNRTESHGDALSGIAASEGIAIGPAFPFFIEPVIVGRLAIPPAARAAEFLRLQEAIATTLSAAGTSVRSESDRAIMDGLFEIARDEDFTAELRAAIAAGSDAVTATLDVGTALAERFAALDDPYLRARAEDVRGMTRAIALRLLGRADPDLATAPPGSIVIADDLNAWDLARVDIAALGGLVCRHGAATAHTAIMARTHGIPAVFGCTLPHVAPGTPIGLDGGRGAVFIAPDGATIARLTAARDAAFAARSGLAHYSSVQPRTKSGRTIHVAANLGSTREIAAARAAGAAGVGLFRTEMAFMERRRPLNEDEQTAIYAELAQGFAEDPVIVRTLDIGGDKSIPGIDIPQETNPFLGWRGLRFCLDRPDLFKPQLRALLRAAVHGNLRIMLPMVSEPGEILRTRALIETCRAELAVARVPHGDPPLGIMIETPASVLMAGELARHSAFFSIGTNDLTQYVVAADRLNPRVAGLNRPGHPAVMKAIELTCGAANVAGIPVGVCGEAAAEPALIPALIGLGVSELSMSPAAILRGKKIISES
ncbi:MAG TPA: phosphoenolpyruvate--protein phosphotransferase [Acidiphilium sp.]